MTTNITTGPNYSGLATNASLHGWQVPKLDANMKPLNETGGGTENAKNYTNGLHNLNATGYVAIEDDFPDTGFSDVQTFILASIATVVPLIVVVVTILGIRFICRKQKETKEEAYEEVLPKDESIEPLGRVKGYSLPNELKTSESQFTMSPCDERMTTPPPHLPTPKSNGSIITMTLKNNHLIVETEETVNIPTTLKIESKGTTTKFVTPAEPDFRIETISHSVSEKSPERFNRTMLSNDHHGALIHSPPPEAVEEETNRMSGRTGFSQSDLSVSSTESQNPNYRYGNQIGYDAGPHGYSEYAGYTMSAQRQYRKPSVIGPQERKLYYRSASMLERGDSMAGEKPFKNILMSDIQALERRIEENNEMRFQEEQRLLGNGGVNISEIQHTIQKTSKSEKAVPLATIEPDFHPFEET
ncbi:hypothetical protein RUM43_014047 [Polyplax serrata]|uniref:Uncharacterized protein n=1 Tax=Polyplax serrata TaxID=468196 RepID=A0AAN8RYX1_POLSC